MGREPPLRARGIATIVSQVSGANQPGHELVAELSAYFEEAKGHGRASRDATLTSRAFPASIDVFMRLLEQAVQQVHATASSPEPRNRNGRVMARLGARTWTRDDALSTRSMPASVRARGCACCYCSIARRLR